MEKNKKSKVLIIVLIILLAWVFFLKDKYDGLTAKEWFNEYDYADTQYREFRSCVEDFNSFDIQTQIDYGGVFYYCE